MGIPLDYHRVQHVVHGGDRGDGGSGVVAFLAYNNIMGLSTFAVNILVLLAIAAGTDYAIFILGRYQEARGLGEDREKPSTPCSTEPRTSSLALA